LILAISKNFRRVIGILTPPSRDFAVPGMSILPWISKWTVVTYRHPVIEERLSGLGFLIHYLNSFLGHIFIGNTPNVAKLISSGLKLFLSTMS
jgi:hypothetical protein